MIYFELIREFFLTGLFMFGGGLSVVPFLQQMSERTGWFSTEELMNMIAIGEATPGPIGINMATYAGYMAAGVFGGVAATVSMMLPTVIIALVIAKLLVKFQNSRIVENALYGLRPAALGLISFAGVLIFCLAIFGTDIRGIFNHEEVVFDYRALIFAAILFISTNLTKRTHPVLFLVISAGIGIIFF